MMPTQTHPITLDPKVWQEGFAAGRRKDPVCPYAAGTVEGWSWSSGCVEGRATAGPDPTTNSGTGNLKFSRASVKRKRALLESNPPSNNRGVRLQTAAEGGGAAAPPPRSPLPVERTLWLENSRSRAPRGEDSWFSLRTLRTPEGPALQACLIACNLRPYDEPIPSPGEASCVLL
jgi:hypothetical protein